MRMSDIYADISPITHSKKDTTTFKPLASPVRTFETPIQQILARQPQSSRSECVIAVRTAGSTKLLEVKPRAATLHGIITTELAAFTRSNFGDRPLMDMAFCDMHQFTLLCVNDHGSVFTCKLEESYPTYVLAPHSSVSTAYVSQASCLCADRARFGSLLFQISVSPRAKYTFIAVRQAAAYVGPSSRCPSCRPYAPDFINQSGLQQHCYFGHSIFAQDCLHLCGRPVS